MSYSTVKVSTTDFALQGRIEACGMQEKAAKGYPETLNLMPLIWAVCSASDVEAAYASALAASNPNPGGDEAVITDQMILSHVQANWPANPA